MNVSIIIVTYNEEQNIADCLQSLLNLDYPEKQVEILVVDGCSTDRTQDVVRGFIKRDKRIRLISNPERTIASNRNMGIRESRYNRIAFVDADCIVPENWLKVLTEAFNRYVREEPNLAAVGGSNVPPQEDRNRFRTALGIMLNSYLGSLGSVQGKVFHKSKTVKSLACLNVLFDRQKLVEVGMFDLEMKNLGEDAELNYRLREKGYSLMYVPGSLVYHKLRVSPGKWTVNMFRYGQGRIVMARKHPALLGFHYTLPLIFLPVFSLSLLSIRAGWFWLFPLLYFPVLFVYSLFVSIRNKKWYLVLWVFYCYLITHWSYSAGMWQKLLSGQKTM